MVEESGRSHPLLGGKWLASLALFSVWAAGVSFMLADALVVVGFAMAIASSIGVLWIYYPELKHVRSGLRSLPADSARTEIVIVICVLIAMFGVALELAYKQILPASVLHSAARLDFAGLQEIVLPDGSTRLRMGLRSTGSLPAISVGISAQPVVARVPLAPNDLDSRIDVLLKHAQTFCS